MNGSVKNARRFVTLISLLAAVIPAWADSTPPTAADEFSTTMAIAVSLALLLPAITLGAERTAPVERRQFTMMKGDGVPVCEAYLGVLNRTPLERTPFCGRPDNGPEPAFAQLERRYLAVEEILPLFAPVWEFMRFNDQDHSGASCGADYAHLPWDGTYTEQRAFGLSADGKKIDEQQTRDLFGMPGAKPPKTGSAGRRPAPLGGLPPGAKPFTPLADSIGIFGYGGRYYIQTENKPASRGVKLPSVEVLLHEHAHTSEVCSFRPRAIPVPE
jgi:hypothetical protein